jgi:poly-gamma-glutamate synthesis protein (capsule biosynthesis protein)
MTPLRMRRFRLERPPAADVEWLRATLDRECRRLGAAVERTAEGRLRLGWG